MGTEIAALDLSDDQIIKATKQIRSDAGTQWKYTLPSGRTVSSEVMREPNAKAIILWCQVIRDQIQVDAENERDKVRQARMEQLAQERRAKSGLVGPDGLPVATTAAPSMIPAMPPALVSGQTMPATLDPTAFLQVQTQTVRQRVQELEQQALVVLGQLDQARQQLAQWESLAVGLGASTTTPTAESLESAASSKRSSKRRGRPVGSKNKPKERQVDIDEQLGELGQ